MALGDNSLKVTLIIAGNATVGKRSISVVSSGIRTDVRDDFPLEIATGGTFEVTASSGAISTTAQLLGVFPTQIAQDERRTVVIAAANSNFREENTVAVFSGVGLNYNFVSDTFQVTPTSLIIQVLAAPDATTGFRSVTVVTGRASSAEILTLSNAIEVVAGGSSSSPFLNAQTFRNGDFFDAKTRVANFGPEVDVDFYVAVELPNGRVMFLAPDGQAFVPQLSPMVQGATLPEGFPSTTMPLFSAVLDNTQPGIYRIYTAFTQAGTLNQLGEINETSFLFLGDLQLPGFE